MKKIFVKGLNWVGDAVMSTPALAHLRHTFPDAHITLMARPWVADVYQYNPDINELWPHNEATDFWNAIKKVRKGEFDIGIAFPNSIRAAALLRLGKIPVRIGYRREWLRNQCLTDKIKCKREYLQEHQVYYYLHLLETLCGVPAQPPKLVLKTSEHEEEEVYQLLSTHGLDRGEPMIGIAPGSINSNAKRWPVNKFAALADRLTKEGFIVLLLGSAKEIDVLERVEALCTQKVYNLCGQLSLAQLIALLGQLKALVCNDSGAMHLAAARNLPTVAIFGPTDWKTTSPFSNNATIIRKPVPCAPCMLRDCPRPEHLCMLPIKPDEVFETLIDLIQKTKRS